MKKIISIFLILFISIGCKAVSEELIPFLYMNRYGYVNNEMSIKISPKFARAENFSSNGFAIVTFDTMNHGIINLEGETIISVNRGQIFHIDRSLYNISDFDKNEHYIINLDDNCIISKYEAYDKSNNGYILVVYPNEKNRYGFIDYNGNRVLSGLILKRSSYSFSNKRARITNEDWDPQIIDIDGNIVGNILFTDLGQRYSEGLISARTSDGLTGYVNESGSFAFFSNFVSNNTIPEATEFSNGYAAIKASEKPSIWKIINNKGQIVADNILVDKMEKFSSGISLVSKIDPVNKEVRYGYINTNGEYLVKTILEQADNFHNGYARIKLNGREGLFKNNAKVIWSSDIMENCIIDNELKL